MNLKNDHHDCDFNTSYVVIKLVMINLLLLVKIDFNTSYVVIKRKFFIFSKTRFIYFNTSYVVIKQYHLCFKNVNHFISIHLMLLLNKYPFNDF